MSIFNASENKSIQELESDTLKYWKDNKIFEKSVEQRSKNNLYVFYDGPPFISGLPHYGHLLGSIAKDIIPRYWTMKGKRVERVWGWDAHGLTVENKVQAKLGIKNRRDIENYGLEKFIKECYIYTSEVSEEWKWYIDKIGRWVDMEHAYKTIDQTYMESVIWAFKQLYDKGFIYEGIYTSLYCTTCGTPVSNFEISMDNTYREVEDPAITVKFPITDNGELNGVNILAWTTTPWTIPSNRALVVMEQSEYVLLECDGEKYIVGQERLEVVFENRKFKKLKNLKGKNLIGLTYEPPYRFYNEKPEEFKVYAFENMVTMDEGTGIVHSAPGFGEIDTQMGRHYNLNIMLSLDDEGKFVPGTKEKNPYEGMFYLKANPLIIKDLQEKNVLFENSKIMHRIPYHDRCDTNLIQKAQNSWFVSIQKLKDEMLKTNEKINWVPSHLKNGRFSIGIKQAPDWCISRTRYWATPMPVWKSDDGEKLVFGSIKELEDLSGVKVENLHRPYIDKIKIKKNGKTYSRIPEVLDSWFEAGSMPFAQIHYPMENQERFENNYPGDYIVEYIAQTRAWFFFMHVLSTSLFGSNSFKNVISTGVMAGSDGRKMSKTYGNYTDPKEVLEKIGGDALRLYLMRSPLMVGENANFDDSELKTMLKSVINPLWNSLKFFLIYSNLYNWKPAQFVDSDEVLDIWIIAKTHMFIQNFSENIENYQIPAAIAPIEKFADDLSRWYVRRSRERISQGDNKALSTLYWVLHTFSKAAAPAIPFISEQIYKTLWGVSVSVHLEEYPTFSSSLIEKSKNKVEEMSRVQDIVNLAHSIRTLKNIPVRQPLSMLQVNSTGVLSPEYEQILKEEINVKEVIYLDNLAENEDFIQASNKDNKISLNIKITSDLEQEGLLREITRKIQGLRREANLTVSDSVEVTYENKPEIAKVINMFHRELSKKVSATNFIPGDSFKVKKVND